jgi:nucleoprotein TPR
VSNISFFLYFYPDQIRTESEDKISELTLKFQDESAKLTLSEQSVTELRDLLQNSKDQLHKTQETLSRYEVETAEYRKERNNVLDERDSLLKICDRRNIEVERLQSDVSTLENQLRAAINAKCESIARLDEILSKEASIDFKEKRFEQERTMLQNQIQSLTDDLNRNINELQNARREYNMKTMTIETKLQQKTEELNIANSQIAHLQETNASLIAKTEELSGKLLAQNEDTRKMMEHYKKELQSQSKLADLYKDTSDDCTKQVAELASAVTELQKLLHEATDEYGQLETEMKGKVKVDP